MDPLVVTVKYTDVDYVVFSDAARYLSQGLSPYTRMTYRYTPILAYLMIPNVYFIHFGKLVFVVVDIFVGVFLYKLLKSDKYIRHPLLYTGFWLFNPLSINVSTRGNSESLVALLVVSSLYLLHKRRLTLFSILFGIAVHFRVYPVIYALPLLFFIDHDACSKALPRWNSVYGIITCRRLCFAFISGGTFFFLAGIMYYLFGYDFLYETYLYHLARTDHRHNFSVFFYSLYLSSSSPEFSPALSKILGLVAFIPQFVVLVVISSRYYKDINFCIFLLTFTFVSFNKVCTVQYFIWFMCLIPIVLPYTDIRPWKGVLLFFSWLAAQGLWLQMAYLLEFQGINTFLLISLSGLVFFFVNIWVMVEFILHHKLPRHLKRE